MADTAHVGSVELNKQAVFASALAFSAGACGFGVMGGFGRGLETAYRLSEGAPMAYGVALAAFGLCLAAAGLYVHLVTRLGSRSRQWTVHAVAGALAIIWVCWLKVSPDEARLPVLTGDNADFWRVWAASIEAMRAPVVYLSASIGLMAAWCAQALGPETEDPYHIIIAGLIGAAAGAVVDLLLGPWYGGLGEIVWRAGFLCAAVLALGAGFWASIQRAPRPVRFQTVLLTTPGRWLVRWFLYGLVAAWITTAGSAHLARTHDAHALAGSGTLAALWLACAAGFAIQNRRPRPAMGVLALFLALLIGLVGRQAPGSFPDRLGFEVLMIAAMLAAIGFELGRRRPPADRMGVFFLVLGVGGAAGSLLGGLLTPLILSAAAPLWLGMILFVLIAPLGQERWRFPLRTATALLLAGAWWSHGHLIVGGRLMAWTSSMAGDFRVAAFESGRALEVNGRLVAGARDGYASTPAPIGLDAIDDPAMAAMKTVMDRRPVRSVGVVGLASGGAACHVNHRLDLVLFTASRAAAEAAREGFAPDDFLGLCHGGVQVLAGPPVATMESVEQGRFDILTVRPGADGGLWRAQTSAEAFGAYLDALAERGILLIRSDDERVMQAALKSAGALGLAIRTPPASVLQFREPTVEDGVAAMARSDYDLTMAGLQTWTRLDPPLERPAVLSRPVLLR